MQAARLEQAGKAAGAAAGAEEMKRNTGNPVLRP